MLIRPSAATRRAPLWIAAGAVALLSLVLSGPARSDDPVSSSVTFNREIIRILDRKCLPCHSAGAIAMSLATYHDARLWSRAIREELVEQRMPPWRAAPGYGVFANSIGLTARELTTILTWTDGGVPRGTDRDLPPPTATVAPGTPDQRIALPVQRIQPHDGPSVRRIVLDTAVMAGRRVSRVQLLPGDRRVLRAAFIYVVAGGARGGRQWIGAWTPWLSSIIPPDGTAFQVPADSTLEIELHYRGRDRAREDRSSIGLFFADDASGSAGQLVVRTGAPSSEDAGARRGETVLRADSRVWAILPQIQPERDVAAADGEAAAADSSLEVTARRPDGTVDVLLWIPHQRNGWPTPYVLERPVRLPAGTRVVVTASHDGSGRAVSGATVTLSLTVARPSERPPLR